MESDSRFDLSNNAFIDPDSSLKKEPNAQKGKTLKVNDFQGFDGGPDGTNI